MKLREHEGKALFERYGIPIPNGRIFSRIPKTVACTHPAVVKAQTLTGDRHANGGIIVAKTKRELEAALANLFAKTMHGDRVLQVLVEDYVQHEKEYYVSMSYDTDSRSPVLSLSTKGGSGIRAAKITPIDLTLGLQPFVIRNALLQAAFPVAECTGIMPLVAKLWNLFLAEHALLAEINPLFKTPDGQYVAGDSKIILDDEKRVPNEKRFIDLFGDIAILASGGGASLLNIDTLLVAKGRPANYTEYSGNPPADVVAALTRRVLSRKGLKGCWVIGGTANFTDIYETLKGFLDGLRSVRPKPRYPIVIRRDGPRKEEAFAMLKEVGQQEGFDFHCFDSHTAMSETATIMVKLAYKRT